MKIVALMLMMSQAALAATSRVEFVDPCSKKAVAATVDGVTQIGVRVEGLMPGELIDAQMEVSPVGMKEDRPRSSHIKEKKQIKADKTGVAIFGFGTGVGRTLRIDSTARLWQADLTWQEHSGSDQGSASSRVYLMTSAHQRFYEIKPDVKSVCSWRKPVEFASPYYFNREAYDLQVSLSVPITAMQSDRGLDIGASPAFTPSSGPLFPSALVGGWAFAGFRSAVTSTSASASISKYIPTGQGGFFIRTVSYARYPAREYRLKQAGSCSQWVSEREGVVDVPRVNYEFAPLPADIASDASKAQSVLEATLPPVEPCAADQGGGADPSALVETDRGGAPVYFRPQSPSK